jgi:methylmalonyl-CoA mutase C-terminal domain/subunit
MQRRIRVLIGKPGLDGHDRGAKLISRVLADAGVEVIYTGKFQTPKQIVGAAVQEDVDGIGLSILSGSHMTMFKRVIELLKEKKAEDIVVFGEGLSCPMIYHNLKRWGSTRFFRRTPRQQKLLNT